MTPALPAATGAPPALFAVERKGHSVMALGRTKDEALSNARKHPQGPRPRVERCAPLRLFRITPALAELVTRHGPETRYTTLRNGMLCTIEEGAEEDARRLGLQMRREA